MTATTPAENPESEEETIKLDQFLKLADIVGSGGEAKHLIRSGAIRVNDLCATAQNWSSIKPST